MGENANEARANVMCLELSRARELRKQRPSVAPVSGIVHDINSKRCDALRSSGALSSFGNGNM